jgi:hypothetical protein
MRREDFFLRLDARVWSPGSEICSEKQTRAHGNGDAAFWAVCRQPGHYTRFDGSAQWLRSIPSIALILLTRALFQSRRGFCDRRRSYSPKRGASDPLKIPHCMHRVWRDLLELPRALT